MSLFKQWRRGGALLGVTTLALLALTGLSSADTANGLGTTSLNSPTTGQTAGSASAANQTSTSSSSSGQAHRTQRLCAGPKKGSAACFAIRQVDPSEPTKIVPGSASPNLTPTGYGPSSLQSAYALPSGTAGSGQTVAIVDAYDDPNAESDLAVYRSQYGLPACTTANGCFKKVNQSGAASPLPDANSSWAGEISLDLDMVSAVCPNCHILLVEADSASLAALGQSVNTAVSLGAKFVSNSYGATLSGGEYSYDSSYFNHPGVAITASSGDSDYDGGSYPATSAYVTAVGGTTLNPASNSRGWSETVWNTISYTEGTGSGCSPRVAKPAFQYGINTGCSGRAEADVSAVADPATGVAVYQTYGGSGWAVYGGTSAASPIIAGVYALAGTPGSTDIPNAYPYAHTSNLNDVTSGTNGACGAPLCTAGSGWDGPTGLGTPNGVSAFRSSTDTTNLAVNGGFESGTASWGLMAGTNFVAYTPYSVAGESPRSGFAYAATNTSQSGGGIYQDVPVSAVAGNVYCASAWVRTQVPNTGASGSFVLWLLGGSSTENGNVNFTGLSNGTGWQQVQTCVSATTSHSQMRIQFYPTANGQTLEIDDVNVHPSMAVNGGFESGTASWGLLAGTNFVAYQSGQVAGESARNGQGYAATNTSQSGGGIYQDVPVSAVAGNVYCASAWVRTQSPNTGASGSFVLWLLGGSSTENGSVNFTGVGNVGWRQVQTCVSATTSHSQMRIQFYPTANGQTLEIDDIDVH